MVATLPQVWIPVAGETAVRPVRAGDGIRLYGATSGYFGLSPAAEAGSADYVLPVSLPTISGQVLSSTDAGVMSWQTIESGITIDETAVSGGGANRILFESAANEVSSSSVLVFDGTNLGVGVVPTNTLDILGTAKVSRNSDAGVLIESLNNNAPFLQLRKSGTARWSLLVERNTPAYGAASNDLVVYEEFGAAKARLVIKNSTGLVGINQPSPDAQLHTVAGSATTIGQIIQGAAAQTAVLSQLRGLSSTSTAREQADWDTAAIDNTDATRKYLSIHRAYDTAAREYARGWGDGSVGRIAVAAPASAPVDAHLAASQISFYLDESGHNLLVRAKYADGTTLKLAAIVLA